MISYDFSAPTLVLFTKFFITHCG